MMPTELKRLEAARELLKLFNSRKRIETIMEKYTSGLGECPFYDRKLSFRCKLTKEVYNIEDCNGKCFNYGFCCSRIQETFERNHQMLYSKEELIMK